MQLVETRGEHNASSFCLLCAMPTKHRVAKTSIDRVYRPIDIRLDKIIVLFRASSRDMNGICIKVQSHVLWFVQRSDR